MDAGQAVIGKLDGTHSVEAVAPTAAQNQDLVLTPGGFRPRSVVTQVAPGHAIDGISGNFKTLDATGAILADHGAVVDRGGDQPLMPGNVRLMTHAEVAAIGAPVPALGSGWITDTRWNRPANQPVRSFTTSWHVPAAPSTQHGQTIFLFNGIQNNSMILQPVLQWGPSAAGGGNNWAVASWFADGQNGQAFFSSLTNVNVGQELVGVMTMTGQLSTLGDTSPVSPALAVLNNIVYIAWKGDGNDNLNVMSSTDGGTTFGQKLTSGETSPKSPALCVHNGILFIAWKGDGNDNLNVARVQIGAGGAATGFANKVVLGDTSPVVPALTSLNGVLYLAWKGDGNDNLNVMSSTDNGATFGHKFVSGETSPQPPALCADNGILFIAWKGDGNDNLNVARVQIGAGGAATGFANKVVLGDTSPVAPALTSLNGVLYLGWKGDGNDNLNVMTSTDNGATFGHKFVSVETSPQPPALASGLGEVFIGWKGDGNDQLNVATVSQTQGAVTGFIGSGNLFSYHCAFTGLPNSALDVRHVAEVWQNVQTLEAYSLQACSDYPNTADVAMTNIAIELSSGNAALTWSVDNQVTDCNQHAVVVHDGSPGGEVDLFFRRS